VGLAVYDFKRKKPDFCDFFAFLARFLITNRHSDKKRPTGLSLPAHYIQP